MAMKERILQFIQSEQISSTQFADTIGVQRSSVSHILSGRNNPSFDFIKKILSNYHDMNPEWLILGEGEMYKTAVSRELFEGDTAVTGVKNAEVLSEVQRKEQREMLRPAAEMTSENIDIERVVIFFNNNTFTEYHPRKLKSS